MTARQPRTDQGINGGGRPAKHPGTCFLCHADFPAGTMIAKDRERYAHAACFRERYL